ncbi:MAG TPA: cyclic nucleotide-binding domain-containing protein [Polyangiales bacterium]
MQPHDRLKRIALFSDLTTEELADLLRIAKVVSFVPGKPLCTRGERAASAFVIDHGEVEVWGVSENGKRDVIARVGPGQQQRELQRWSTWRARERSRAEAGARESSRVRARPDRSARRVSLDHLAERRA